MPAVLSAEDQRITPGANELGEVVLDQQDDVRRYRHITDPSVAFGCGDRVRAALGAHRPAPDADHLVGQVDVAPNILNIVLPDGQVFSEPVIQYTSS
jgi:hypothetical protein